MDLGKIKITPRRAGLLAKMGITSVEDLLRTFPLRYETVERMPFEQWQMNSHVCFEATIINRAYVVRFGGKRSKTSFKVRLTDEPVELSITLFNRPWTNMFASGKRITIFGEYMGGDRVTAANFNFKPLSEQLGMNPVYPLTQGLRQYEMRDMIKKALPYVYEIPTYVPERYRQKYRLDDVPNAIRRLHQPRSKADLIQAARSLKYEEFLIYQCVMQSTQSDLNDLKKPPKHFDAQQLETWISQLAYPLTPDQKTAVDEIKNDLRSERVMFRLVQGDVGCGKTVVAAAALYMCMLSGHQGAFLAPTEILARQHVENLQQMNLPASLYVSAMSAKEKKAVLEGLAEGSIQIVVGTHALFQENVQFHDLGLVVADEQQRFGVRQRRALLEKGRLVDFLMMSATPIPRTYAHFIYGNMNISSIKTMPPGRQPVQTKYYAGTSMKPFIKELLADIQTGRQCYVVCAAIEEDNDMGVRSVLSVYKGMQQTLKNLRIGLIHGKMSGEEKEAVMSRFAAHELDILVSTTVIEVGIDVKNATLMVIYDAHHFGLSTLHQLRGRTARGSVQGKCFLLSSSKDPAAISRLKKLETLTDGFAVSEYDLKTRGPGDLLGTRQSGIPSFALGDPVKDRNMMAACVQDAQEILTDRVDEELLTYVRKEAEKSEFFD